MKYQQAITEGDRRMRLSFNPDGDDTVADVKQQSARLIDLIYCAGKDPRLTSLAMTSFEEGAMWAVKSLTSED